MTFTQLSLKVQPSESKAADTKIEFDVIATQGHSRSLILQSITTLQADNGLLIAI